MKHVFSRAELKEHLPQMIELIQKKHENPSDLIDEFIKHSGKLVKDLTHTRRYFAQYGTMFFQFQMAYIVMEPELDLIGRAVEEVIVYDTYTEFEADRVKTLSGHKDSEGLNWN